MIGVVLGPLPACRLKLKGWLSGVSTEGVKKHELAARSMYFFKKYDFRQPPGDLRRLFPFLFWSSWGARDARGGSKTMFFYFFSMFFGTLCKFRKCFRVFVRLPAAEPPLTRLEAAPLRSEVMCQEQRKSTFEERPTNMKALGWCVEG